MPLTATPMPEEDTPEFAAIKELMREVSPKERAESFKESGNEAFKLGKKDKYRYTDAIVYYTQGLEVQCKDDQLNSQLYSNRALVQLTTGNAVVSCAR